MGEYRAIAERIALDRPTKVLDWGCGYGQITQMLRKAGVDVVAFEYRRDLPEGTIEYPWYSQLDVHVSPDPVRLPFADDEFDAVLSCGVLEHVADPDGSLDEIARVLRPDGRFYVYKLPNRFSYIEWLARRLGIHHHGCGPHDKLYDRGTARRLLERHGFSVLELRRANMLPLNRTAALGFSTARAISRLSSSLARVPGVNVAATNLELVAVNSRDAPGGDPASPGVALVADARLAGLALGPLSKFDATQRVEPSPIAAFSPSFRRSRIGLVGAEVALPGAALAGRLFRLPWGLVLDRPGAERLAARSEGIRARLASQAWLAVVAGDAVTAIEAFAPRVRVVTLDDAERLRSVLADVALPVEETRPAGGLFAPLVANGWMFVDDRATRLAIHLVSLTRRAHAPLHPKHLLDVPWHWWYLSEIGPTDRVLDVGCHNGMHSLTMAPRAAHVLGIDVDENELARARERAAIEGVANVEFHRGDLTDRATLGDLRPGSFDVALILDVLEHLVDRRSVLDAVRTLLRPGGRLVVAVPNADTSYKRWRRRLGGRAYSNPDHKVEFSEDAIRAELEDVGFRIERLERGGYDTPFDGLTSLVGVVSLAAYRRISERRYRLLQRRPQDASAFRIVAVKELNHPCREGRAVPRQHEVPVSPSSTDSALPPTRVGTTGTLRASSKRSQG
jgi:2-polyprenyl-3-methyl-5-hydroxy-6-metoxy-1,4-benzoquinol methylase